MSERNQWVNYVVSASNIAALWPLWHAPTPWHAALTVAAMLASMLMHISERKHNLPGVWPFRQWSKQLEWADRAVAYTSMVYVALRLLTQSMPWAWPIGLGGLAALALAEHWEGGPVWFVVTHCTWHLAAYSVLAMAFVA